MSAHTLKQLDALLTHSEKLDMPESLQLLAATFPGDVTFSTSFSNEDQVIAHQIARSEANISLFTLDTGRLFQTTYNVWQETATHLGLQIRAYYPEPAAIQAYTTNHGPNAFYESVELRQDCCYIRKVAPLKKALEGKDVWITGLRAEHSSNRGAVPVFEWDEEHSVIKYHPLLHWTTEQVTAYIKRHQLPYNSLTEKGFVSIGCEPCTRAIKPGEPFRAGRWWWEENSKKECGLHVHTPTSETLSKNNNKTLQP